MANGTNINLLCDKLENLLKDICTFLNDETIDKILPQPRKVKAKLLLERSNEQLESLRGISKNCSTVVHRCEDQESIFTDASEMEELANSAYKDQKCANDTCGDEVVNGKSGSLLFHKNTFFFENTKKVFVAIFRHWFIVYADKSALKPLHVINLTKYQSSTCADLPYHIKKKEKSFDVIPINGSKFFRFTADSPTDMLEWVTEINHSCQKFKPPMTTRRPLEENFSKGLKKNKTPSRRSFDTLDDEDERYITVIASSSTESLSAEENDKVYDTLGRINKRTLTPNPREEKRRKEDGQNEYDLLANNCKLITMDIGTYWKNKENSLTNKY